MTRVLVDTSIWVDFFKGNDTARPLFDLLENGTIVTNDLILTELLPSIRRRQESALEGMLLSIEKIPMLIDWEELAVMQLANISSGNNNMGIPDLMILQNSLQNKLVLFENDKHFRLAGKIFGVPLFSLNH